MISNILSAARLGAFGRLLAAGSFWGALACTVHGGLEAALLSVIPVLVNRNTLLTDWHWRYTATLLGVYVLAGVALGAVSAFCLAVFQGTRAAQSQVQVVALIPLVGASLMTLLMAPALPRIALVVTSLLLVMLIAAVASRRWAGRLRFCCDLWTVNILLLAPWLSRALLPSQPESIKRVVSLCSVLLVASVAAALHYIRGYTHPLVARVFAWRQIAAVAVAAALLVAVAWLVNPALPQLPPNSGRDSGQPNVLLVSLDTVRADHLSVYGYQKDTTPHLRKLAEEATLYKHALATSDMTLATHASIFTGLYPNWHGAHFVPPAHPHGRPLAPRFQTMAEILSANGYFTAAVPANTLYLNPNFGLDQGFQLFDSRITPPVVDPHSVVHVRSTIVKILNLFVPTAGFYRCTRTADEINKDLLVPLRKV